MGCYVDMIISYCRLMLSKRGLSVRDASKEYRSPEPSNDYFDFLSEFGYINSPKSVYCFNYPSRVVNTGYISLPSVKRGDIFDYLLNSPKVAPKDKGDDEEISR